MQEGNEASHANGGQAVMRHVVGERRRNTKSTTSRAHEASVDLRGSGLIGRLSRRAKSPRLIMKKQLRAVPPACCRRPEKRAPFPDRRGGGGRKGIEGGQNHRDVDWFSRERPRAGQRERERERQLDSVGLATLAFATWAADPRGHALSGRTSSRRRWRKGSRRRGRSPSPRQGLRPGRGARRRAS